MEKLGSHIVRYSRLLFCLVQQVQVGIGSKYFSNASFPTALGGGILN